MQWAAEDVVDYALIGQDDTAPYGWNIAEARALRQLIDELELTDRASVYPGADELAGLLVAAYACRNAGFRPRVWSRYSGPDGPSVVTSYEDRPLQDLVKALDAGTVDLLLILGGNPVYGYSPFNKLFSQSLTCSWVQPFSSAIVLVILGRSVS